MPDFAVILPLLFLAVGAILGPLFIVPTFLLLMLVTVSVRFPKEALTEAA